MEDYYEIDNPVNSTTNERFYQSILEADANIEAIGSFKVWEILVCVLSAFIVILSIIYSILKTCSGLTDDTDTDSEDDEDETNEKTAFNTIDILIGNNLIRNNSIDLRSNKNIQKYTLSIANLAYLNPSLQLSCTGLKESNDEYFA